jgi:hypothetical protein
MKFIGKEGVLDPERIAALILERLGPQPEADRLPTANRKGAYIAYTFWVTLPDEQAERPLREAIHALPGCVMQL